MLLRELDSNERPPGYEPGELPTAPSRDVQTVCFLFASAKVERIFETTKYCGDFCSKDGDFFKKTRAGRDFRLENLSFTEKESKLKTFDKHIQTSIAMQILLADAKTMKTDMTQTTDRLPRFEALARALADEMAEADVDDLKADLKCSAAIAAGAQKAFRQFATTPPCRALLAYDGTAYKHLQAGGMSRGSMAFADEHLWITTFMYGLLRPADGIRPYRVAPSVQLAASDGLPLGRFWRSLLTPTLIGAARQDDGVLLHLSTTEYEQLFDWRELKQSLRIVQPRFLVRQGDKLSVQAVWAKACRGAMVRFVCDNQITRPEDLPAFTYEGFVYDTAASTADVPVFVRG